MNNAFWLADSYLANEMLEFPANRNWPNFKAGQRFLIGWDFFSQWKAGISSKWKTGIFNQWKAGILSQWEFGEFRNEPIFSDWLRFLWPIKSWNFSQWEFSEFRNEPIFFDWLRFLWPMKSWNFQPMRIWRISKRVKNLRKIDLIWFLKFRLGLTG